jgi:chemotaxis protein methyltransferase CheR
VAPILAAIAREDFAHARTGLAELPREADEDPDALLVKATLHIHTSDSVSAGETCRKLLELDGMNAGAHFVLGLCCEKAEDRSGAAQRYKTAIYFDPNFAMPHLRLGLIARASGNRGEARRELSQALVLLGGEDASRLLLFGGGFNRKSLIGLCEGALRDNAVQL